jgi:hypothetical protein
MNSSDNNESVFGYQMSEPSDFNHGSSLDTDNNSTTQAKLNAQLTKASSNIDRAFAKHNRTPTSAVRSSRSLLRSILAASLSCFEAIAVWLDNTIRIRGVIQNITTEQHLNFQHVPKNCEVIFGLKFETEQSFLLSPSR